MSSELHPNNAFSELEKKWRFLAEAAPDIILAVSRNGKIIAINHTVPGITTEQAIGSDVYQFLPPEHQDQLRQAIEYVFSTGKLFTYEVAGMGPNGKISWYLSRIGPVMEGNQVVAATLITSDITVRKEAEDTLKRSNEVLESKVQARTIELQKINWVHPIENVF